MSGSYLRSYTDGTEMGIWTDVTLETTLMALRWVYGQKLP